MPLRLAITTVNLMINALGNVLNSGKLRIYAGVQPITPETAVTTQTKLLEYTLNVDAFPNAIAGVMTANAITAKAALASGKATWYRLVNAAGTTTYVDGVVGLTGSTADAVLDSVDLTVGQVVSVVLFRYTLPRVKP